MKKKGIIFDKDGTLIDFDSFWQEIAIAAVQSILNELNIDEKLFKGAMNAIGVIDGETDVDGVLCKGTYGDIGRELQAYFAKNNYVFSVEEVINVTIEAFHKNADKGLVVATCADICSTLIQLKQAGVKIAVVTSDDPFVTGKCLEALKIDKLFDIIYTDDGTHPNKPDPYCIMDFCERFGLKQEEVAMVGDSLTDVLFAKNAGVMSIGVAKTKGNVEFLTGKADIVVPDISFVFEVIK